MLCLYWICWKLRVKFLNYLCVLLDGFAALSPWERIGSHGARNFMLCKKPQANNGVAGADDNGTTVVTPRGGVRWKAWFNKSLNLKISTH
jgi:hypothetical protein